VDWTSTAGAHEIFVMLDPDETITEWDEENNRAFALIKVLADLSISVADISLTIPEPDVPNEVEISVTVHNLGGVGAENVNVAFYQGDPLADAPLIDSETIPAITAGSSETASISWTAPAGTSDIYVRVDEAKEIDERDEANNTAFNSITIILKPDLSLTAEDISLDAEFPLAGKPTIITANVHNENNSVVGVLVSFYDGDPEAGGILIGSDLIPTIDASATGIATVEWDTTDEAGEHILYIIADEQEKIDELDETNNVAQKSVEVVICGDLSGNGESTAYDAALILQSVVGLATLTPAQIAAADTSDNGSISALDAALVLQYSVGLISIYPALGPTQGTPILWANPASAEIQIGSLSAKIGQIVSVPIFLRGDGILAVEMILNYDDELLEFQGLNRKLAKTEFSHSDGRLQIAVAGDADLPKGELIFVNFLLKNSVSLISEIPLTFAKAEINEGNFAVRLKSGSISILPDKYSLLQNYPNPFNPDTWIPYQLPESADVLIKIYNVRGELVRTLALGVQPAGNYVQPKKAAYWDGRNDAGEKVASAIYFYTLKAGNFTATRKMVILK
ncbi:TPA: T9SS type A sorting domain-containing protein, partial [Candidatus Poribacteria bacterium]|nr:T9SS type A sorting domain-containing protein [Candidatus Poribacteria bacterium]